MDPVDIREERITTGAGVPPAGGPPPVNPYGVPPPVSPYGVAGAPATTAVYTRTSIYPAGWRTIQLIWLIVGVVDIIIALDFVFRAAGGHDRGFAHFVYRLGGWLAAPFDGIFNTTAVAHGTSVFRWSDVLAVAIYSIAAWILAKLVRILSTPRTGPA